MMRRLLFLLLVLGFAGSAAAQNVVNPRTVTFDCPDHALDDEHELDIVRVSDGLVIQTILLGHPPLNANGQVEATINVQPIAFGTYYGVVRAVAGTLKSANSDPSNLFDRAPGKPSNLQLAQAQELVPQHIRMV